MQRTLLVALSLCSLASAQFRASDDFNRPNSTSLGSLWREDTGDTVIEGNEGKGNSRFTNGWMEFRGLAGDYRRARLGLTVRCNAFGGDHVALIAALDPSTWDAVYVRLQDNNGDGLFDRVLFERGITGGGWGGGNPVRYDLLVPTVSARLELDFENGGDLALLTIANQTSGQIERCQAAGLLTMPFGAPSGSAVGIGHFGDPYFDDFQVELEALQGTPRALSRASAGTQNLALDFGLAHANRGYLILGSLSGTVPGFVLDGQLVPLVPDAYFLYTVQAAGLPPLLGGVGMLDASGRAQASFTLPAGLPPSVVGLSLWHAAIVYEPSGAPPFVRAASNAERIDISS